jgi:hypothetical protein
VIGTTKGRIPLSIFAPSIPGGLLASIVLGDRIEVARELSRIPATSPLLAACGRLASANGQCGVLEGLFENGFQANDAEALKCGAAGGWTRAIEYLRAHGAELEPIGNELAVAAARAGHLDTLRYLHVNGCSLESCAGLLSELASKPSHRPVFAYLAANGVFPNADDVLLALAAVKEGNLTTLALAIRNLDVHAVAPLLIEAACKNGSVECLKLLEQHGCNIRKHGRQALLAGAQAGECEVVRYLVTLGLTKEEWIGEAARLSVELGHAHIVKYLCEARYASDQISVESVCLARMNGHSSLIEMLRTLGVDHTQDARTPLPAHGAAAARGSSCSTISLLLANYNNGIFLRTSLEAVLSQTRLPDEIIIVDDGSTDESIEVIQRFISMCPRARLLRHERNLGQHAAIQRALLEARCDYIVWASSDDLLLPRFIEKSVNILSSHPGVGLCFSQLCAWREDTGVVRQFSRKSHGAAFDLGTESRCYSPRELREVLRRRYLWISGNTVVARRDALLAMGGFDARLRWHADWFAFYAVALRHGACSIPETLAMMRERDQTYSGDGMIDRTAQRVVLRAVIDVIRAPENRDLYEVFRKCPSLLSPFGGRMLVANAVRASTWHLMLSLFVWLLPRKLKDIRAQFGFFRERVRTQIGHGAKQIKTNVVCGHTSNVKQDPHSDRSDD